ncbi:MAG: TolC family protein [bacterium]
MRKFEVCVLLVLLAAAPAAADTLRLDAAAAVELALKNNHAVRTALARVEEAAAGKAATFGSLLPQLSASASYVRLGTVNRFTMVTPVYGQFPLRVYDPLGNLIGFTDSIPMAIGADTLDLELGGADNFSLTGTAELVLFTWGKLFNAWRIAGLSLDMQQEGLRLARLQVRTRATEGFYNALLARKLADLMQQSYDQLERHIEQVRVLYENGLATGLDVKRASVGLTNLQVQLNSVRSGEALAEAALRNTIGVEPETPIALAGDLEREDWDIGYEAARDSALTRRPELEQLRQAMRMADLGVRIARTANLPSLFSQFNYGYKNPVGFSAGWGTDWNLVVGAQMPLFTGGANLNKLKQARAKERQARIALAMVEDAVGLEVRALHSALEQERHNIELQSGNVQVAEEALQMAETGYQNGLVTNLEYLDTQLALTQSRVSHLSSLANHRIARARLLQAMGISEEN